ncbi:MAG: High-affinity branched-chain amino acid transport ATP-binding protein LivF [Actinomycetia bacterium]|jgi:ABC-type branched-subunit amino acid transport system ATPase component|nr:High-affinity branched-chain amino acid transport ATP-binding protein LivF [Actinomycetes bacterium]
MSILLELHGVWAGYDGGDVLRDLTLSVPAGSITCVVGPNGAGKSTVLRVISGQLIPRRGTVVFDGEEIGGLSPRKILSRGIVQVAQEHTLFPDMTVRENVELGGFLLRDRAEVARRLRQIEDLFPIVTDRGGERAGALSGGQQRLVEFARCLMLDPKLVVLDEPSMGLDPKTLRTVLQQVAAMRDAGRTILLVEQNVRAGLSLAGQAVVLESGHVRLAGTGAQVLANPDIAHLYLGGAPRSLA